jgi:hypothetical protein
MTVDCSGTCTRTDLDPLNCGMCGTACAMGEFCVGGACTGCPMDTVRCDRFCTDTDVDPLHCGMCNNACARGERCRMGACM